MKCLAPLIAVLALACLVTGCATQKTKNGRTTTVLGGLVKVESGSYQAASVTTIPLDGAKLIGRNNPSGTQVSVLWGLITYTDN